MHNTIKQCFNAYQTKTTLIIHVLLKLTVITISDDEDMEDKSQEDEVQVSVLIPDETGKHSETRDIKILGKTLTLSIAYAANVGGSATLIGTLSNVVMQGYAEELVLPS